ncbi:MAG: hypothetical protein HY698_17915 [Deltaproteobacteria bacterium]|nr:hypothetical protein [Deltaproteobacteria bacterium]
MVARMPEGRVANLMWQYDWLGNMTHWTDDANAFYERSIGTITNGNAAGASGASLRPSALYLASDLRGPATDRGGWVEMDYGVSGNAVAMTVHAQCVDRTPATCGDMAGSDVGFRRGVLRSTCACASEQRYEYRWDEVNRLAEARRYDRAGGGGEWKLKVRQRYRYDGANVRTVKQTVDAEPDGQPAERVAIWPYPGDFERRGLVRGVDRYAADVTLGTETQYLVAGARVVWKKGDAVVGLDGDHRMTVGLGDLIGTTSAVIDLKSGDLVETSTYYPNGARETYRTVPSGVVPAEPEGFTGKEADEEVGLVYFGERYLIPRLGRWASPDPLAIHALGGGEVMNSYHYVSGNLLQARDPLGLVRDEEITSQGEQRDARKAEMAGARENAITLVPERQEIAVGSESESDDPEPPETISVSHAIYKGEHKVGYANSIEVRGAGRYYEIYDFNGTYLDRTPMEISEPAVQSPLLEPQDVIPTRAVAKGGKLASMVGRNLVKRPAVALSNAVSRQIAKSFAVRGAGQAAKVWCFPAGTLVQTPQGPTEIQNIKPGDVVFALDESSGEVVSRRVVEVARSWSKTFVQLNIGDRQITSTAGHSYWVASERKWVAARDLKAGTHVLLLDGNTREISAVQVRDDLGLVEVFNFTVGEHHNYFVGPDGVLVHNGGPDVFDDYNQARNAALEWLEARGFRAEAQVGGKFGPNAGKPIGMSTADGRVGFRVEFDARSGAHINVFAGKEKGPHFKFKGTQATVNKIVRRFLCH